MRNLIFRSLLTLNVNFFVLKLRNNTILILIFLSLKIFNNDEMSVSSFSQKLNYFYEPFRLNDMR